MDEKLLDILINSSFSDNYLELANKFKDASSNADLSLEVLAQILQQKGYKTHINQKDKYVKIDKGEQVSLNIAIENGIVDFILDAEIDGVGTGGPFDFLLKSLEDIQPVPVPKYSSNAELEEIISEGLLIYEDLKNKIRG
jgi:hypothetical protein